MEERPSPLKPPPPAVVGYVQVQAQSGPLPRTMMPRYLHGLVAVRMRRQDEQDGAFQADTAVRGRAEQKRAQPRRPDALGSGDSQLNCVNISGGFTQPRKYSGGNQLESSVRILSPTKMVNAVKSFSGFDIPPLFF